MRAHSIGCLLLISCISAPTAIAAHWPSPPVLDVNAGFPSCPDDAAGSIRWESYRADLDDYLKYRVEAFWTEANAKYRDQLERERAQADSELRSHQITMDQYRTLLDEYRSRSDAIDGDLKNNYQHGIEKYHVGIALYYSYRDQHKRRWQGW